MSHTDHSGSEPTEELSLPLFFLIVGLSLLALILSLKLIAPDAVWQAQISSGLGAFLVAFLVIKVANCFGEFFFHRYVLHKPVVPLFSYFYRQHTKHHGLTRIARRRTRDGEIAFVENVFPITEPEQKEASFFPWYSLLIFSIAVTPGLALLQWLLPAFPWFLAGYAAVSVSLVLYEVLHVIEHWPLEKWMPLIQHPRWGWLWRRAYSFHLRHHAVIDCNEAISGFFSLPLADWIFGTCVIPKTLYAHGETWEAPHFTSPQPCRLIRWMDRITDSMVARRRRDGRKAA